MSVQVVGLDVLINFLGNIPSTLKQEVDGAMGVAAQMVYSEATRLVPVRTGRLKRSIEVKHPNMGEWTVGSILYYAGFVEYGTSRMRAQPYLRPALMNTLPRIRPVIFDCLEDYFNRRG